MISQRKAGLVLSYATIFVLSFVGLLFTPFLIASLGEIEYGLYQLMFATIGYVSLLDFGLGGTLTRYILKYKAAGDKAGVDSVTSMGTKIYLFTALLTIALTLGVASLLDQFYPHSLTEENLAYARKLFVIMGASAAISFISHAMHGIETAYERYTITKGMRLLRQIVRVLVLYILLKMGMKAMAIVMVDFCLTLAVAVFDTYYCKYCLHATLWKGKWDNALLKSLMTFSFFVFLQILVTQLNNNMDRIILGRYSTLQMVALYAVAMQIYNLFNSFGGVIPSITLPQISNVVFSGASDREVSATCARLSRYQFILLALPFGCFILYGREFAEYWLPEYDSTQVWIIAMLISLPQLLEFVENPIFNVMKAKNMQAVRSLLLMAVAIGHIALALFFIRIAPVFGCAIAACISFVIGNNIISNIYYHKRVGIIIPFYFKKLLVGLLPAWILSMMVGTAFLYLPGTGWLALIARCTCYALCYSLLIYLIGTNEEEKKVIRELAHKIKII